MPAFLIQNQSMALSADGKDARMLLEVPSSMNNVINDQFTLKLVHFSLNVYV